MGGHQRESRKADDLGGCMSPRPPCRVWGAAAPLTLKDAFGALATGEGGEREAETESESASEGGGVGLGAGRTECFFSFVFVLCVCGGRGEGDWGALLELVRPVWHGIWLLSKAHYRCFGNCGAAAMAYDYIRGALARGA